MTPRTYVLIFFAWAILVVITPTLILLSESARPEDSDGFLAEVVKLRRSPIFAIPKNAAALTYTSGTGVTAYRRNMGLWDLISMLTSLPTRQRDDQLFDDPWEGGAV